MKNIFIILMVFCLGVVLNAQDYSFDRKCIVKSTRLKPKRGQENYRESVLYLNTGNSSYYMTGSKIGNYFLTDNQKAETTQIQHSLVNGSSFYRAVGFKKTDFSSKGSQISKVTVEKTPDGSFLVRAVTESYGNKSSQRFEFTLKKSTIPLLQVGFIDLSPRIEKAVYEALLKELDSPNYQIETVKIMSHTGYHNLYDYTDCETVSLNFQFQDN